MNLAAFSLILLFLSLTSVRAGVARKRELASTATSTASSTLTAPYHPTATPITTALPRSQIPLSIPQVGPSQSAKGVRVEYLGPGNRGSTVYEVVFSGQMTAAPPVTATLIEDATNAELVGGQLGITIDGQETVVYAAASCGFADGLAKGTKSKAAGYCVYWYVVDHATSTWTSAVTDISAQTSIHPTTRSKEPHSTESNHIDANEWTSSAARRCIPPAHGMAVTVYFLAVTFALFSVN